MELQVARARLELPAAGVLQAPAPPKGFRIAAPIQLPFAKGSVELVYEVSEDGADGADPAGDCWLGAFLSLDADGVSGVPSHGALGFFLCTTAEGASRQWLRNSMGETRLYRDAWWRTGSCGLPHAVRWSHLRQLAAAGAAALQFTAAFLDTSTPLGGGAALCVASPMGSMSAHQLFGPHSQLRAPRQAAPDEQR